MGRTDVGGSFCAVLGGRRCYGAAAAAPQPRQPAERFADRPILVWCRRAAAWHGCLPLGRRQSQLGAGRAGLLHAARPARLAPGRKRLLRQGCRAAARRRLVEPRSGRRFHRRHARRTRRAPALGPGSSRPSPAHRSVWRRRPAPPTLAAQPPGVARRLRCRGSSPGGRCGRRRGAVRPVVAERRQRGAWVAPAPEWSRPPATQWRRRAPEPALRPRAGIEPTVRPVAAAWLGRLLPGFGAEQPTAHGGPPLGGPVPAAAKT
eukprot:scaffold24003_cov90-Isochrysis_galbana.AAC.1